MRYGIGFPQFDREYSELNGLRLAKPLAVLEPLASRARFLPTGHVRPPRRLVGAPSAFAV